MGHGNLRLMMLDRFPIELAEPGDDPFVLFAVEFLQCRILDEGLANQKIVVTEFEEFRQRNSLAPMIEQQGQFEKRLSFEPPLDLIEANEIFQGFDFGDRPVQPVPPNAGRAIEPGGGAAVPGSIEFQ